MVPCPRTLRRKFAIRLQAALLILVALALIASFRCFSSSDSSSISIKPSDKKSISPNVPAGTGSSISSRRLESPTIESTWSLAPESNPAQSSILLKDVNATLLERASVYVKAIMTPGDDHFPRLSCPPPKNTRYDYLRQTDSSKELNYFFALDLHRRAKILPRLLGSIIETIRFLGPKKCALSIVKGSWDDGTFIILERLREELEAIGVTYFVYSSDIAQGVSEPLSTHRDLALESLIKHPDRFSTDLTMNTALSPLTHSSARYSPTTTTVIFLNNVAICMEDILELLHQRLHQKADMTCATDWTFDPGQGEIEPTFHDVWVTRGMTGDAFVNITADSATHEYTAHLLWNDPVAQARFYAHEPFQVFSCWSGAVVFTAAPLLAQEIKFRTPNRDGGGGGGGGRECTQGEAQLFCKDMWHLGHGRIATVPAVSVGYTNEDAQRLKALKGYVGHWVGGGSGGGGADDGADGGGGEGKEMGGEESREETGGEKEEMGDGKGREEELEGRLIEWQDVPPAMVKCFEGPWTRQTWVPWDEGLPTR